MQQQEAAVFPVTTATNADIASIRNHVLQRLVRDARDPQIAPDRYDKHSSSHSKNSDQEEEKAT
jgi:hypothetical protein